VLADRRGGAPGGGFGQARLGFRLGRFGALAAPAAELGLHGVADVPLVGLAARRTSRGEASRMMVASTEASFR
jgi:hypothetical protein